MLAMVSKANRHMEPEEVEKYSMGDTSEEQAARFEEHLLLCAACRDRLAESDQYVRAMRRAGRTIRRKGEARSGIHPFPRWMPLVAAAAMIVGAILFGWSRIGRRAEFPVSLIAMRGGEVMAQAPAETPLVLNPDTTGLAASRADRLEMVDATGNRVWQGRLPAHVPAQRPGTYYVRLIGGDGQPQREYGLVLK